MLILKQVITEVIFLFTMFGCLLSYLPQYLLMRKNKSIGAFNPLICHLIVFSCSLRLAYRYGRDYHYSLVVQAIVLIISQLVILKKCLELQAPSLPAVFG